MRFLRVSLHAPPACYHIWRLRWYPYRQQAACPPRWAKRESVSSSLGQQKLFQVSHSWKLLCACFTYGPAGAEAAHSLPTSELGNTDAASVPFLLWKVHRSHFFRLHGTPQKWKTHQKSVWICYPSLNIRQAAAATKTTVERLLCDLKGSVLHSVAVLWHRRTDSRRTLHQEPEPHIKFLLIVTARPILAAGLPRPRQSLSHSDRDVALDR